MSSMTLCLFGVALCNIGSLDQTLFGQQPQNQQPNVGFGGQNGFNNYGGNGNGGGQFNQPQQQNRNNRPPHQSPCRARFQYVTDGNQWKGIIRFANWAIARDNIIEADFALPQRFVSLKNNKKSKTIQISCGIGAKSVE